MNKVIRVGAIAILAAVSVQAWAGYPVEGTGSTKREAMDDADRRAIQQGGCERIITHAKVSDCRHETDGTWTCVAYVANHENC